MEQEGYEVPPFPANVAQAVHERAVLHERAQGTPFQRTTRRPSTCGCSFRVHSGLPPREDHASNLVGLVRDIIGLLGWRRPFRVVRHIGQKWATCTLGRVYQASWTPQSRGARSARKSQPQRARAARASEGV